MAISKPVNLFGYKFNYHRLVKLTVDLVPPSPNPGVSSGVWELLFAIYANEEARRAGEQPAGAERILKSDPPPEVLAAWHALSAEIYKWVTAPTREITMPMPVYEQPQAPTPLPGQPGAWQVVEGATGAAGETVQPPAPIEPVLTMRSEPIIDPSSVTPYNGAPEA